MTIGFGDLVLCQIDVEGDTDTFRFSGAAGEVVTIFVSRQGGLGSVMGALLDPSGIQIHQPAGRIDMRLSKTGVHTIRVIGQGQPVTYAVSLERLVPPSPSATPLSPGQRLVDTLDPGGDVDLYFFRGAAGDRVTVRVARESGIGGPVLEVFDPEGRQIGRATDQVAAQLEKSGLYIAHVTASSATRTLSYSISLECEGACPPVVDTLSRLFIPYVSAGRMGQMTRQTTFVLMNSSPSPVSGSLEVFRPDGQTPFEVAMAGVTDSSFPLSIPPGGVRILETENTTSLLEGFARATTDLPISASAFIRVADNRNRLSFKIGYNAPAPGRSFTVLADSRGPDRDSGLIILNPGEFEQRADVTLRLLDRDGQQAGGVLNVSLDAGTLWTGSKGEVIRFMTGDLFPNAAGIGQFEGTIAITSSIPVSVLAVQQDGDQLTILQAF